MVVFLSIFLKKKVYKYKLEMGVGEKLLPMLRKVVSILDDVFGRKVSISKRKNLNLYRFQTTVKNLMEQFRSFDIKTFKQVTAPDWINSNINYFGAFLAGVIDGDGNITITRKSYPMCSVLYTLKNIYQNLRNF